MVNCIQQFNNTHPPIMKTLGMFLVLALCYSAAVGNLRQHERRSKRSSDYNPLQLSVDSVRRRPIPKYVLSIYRRIMKQGSRAPYNNLQCVFPKILRTRRAIKVIFKNDSLKEEEKSKWIGDELRIFMNTAKKSISSSKRPYFVKIFDLFSRRLVNIYKFSSKDYGWKTINITDWRKDTSPRQDHKGRLGLKIVVVLGKKKLSINKTAFRKSKTRNEPYFIEFFHEREEEEKIDILKPRGLSIHDRYNKNNEALPKNGLAKRDYFLPFQRYGVDSN